ARKKRNAHQQLVGGNTAGPECADARVCVELGGRIVCRREQRRVEVRDGAASVIVVRHHVDEIEQRNDAIELDVGDLRRARRRGDRQLVMSLVFQPLRIELAAQLGEKQREVLSVDWALDISLQTALYRKLPVDVNSVEETRPTPDEKIDCRAGKAPSRRI